MNIEFHADDYGLFPEQSRHIMECREQGALNGISIMPNSPYLAQCMDEIRDVAKDLFITCHLNLVEGKPLTGEKASLLADKDGNFAVGFGKLLIVSMIPFVRDRYRAQIREELDAQLKACAPYMNDGIYRIDGHVHYHMLPVVFDALMDVIWKRKLKVSYIRFPSEVLPVYSAVRGKTRDFKPINYVKVMILNALGKRNRRKYDARLSELGLENRLFMGVMLSGHMFYENIEPCIPKAVEIATDRGFDGIEILFHPGDVSSESEYLELTSKDDVEFLTVNSEKRQKEALALKTFGEKR